ncbi:Ctr copper transporter [Dillenia turbinata]|uniref:Copper transport protein n=1 Tax=Dillenia turbinata TaxID=194707 RepID=A0AAN8Z6S9_9MAGN
MEAMHMGGHDDHYSDHGMGGMNAPPPSHGGMIMHHKMMMHMTFFWGKDTEVLFSGWPGTRTGMYVAALVFVFALAVLVEWLSHCNFIKPGPRHVGAGLTHTLLYTLRLGLSYMLMLALMSFNGGIFIAGLIGHTVGFLIFGSRVFKRSSEVDGKTFDLPPMHC